MSEHQVYEFKAIDASLSAKDKAYVEKLSSRVRLTSTSAYFVYNYGDFRGRPEQVVDRCFDIMVYLANFGVRRLIMRFPKSLINPDIFKPYCVPYLLSVSTTEKSVILDMSVNGEDYYVWIDDDESWVDDLSELRNDILKGDLRSLYLSWLSASLSENGPQEWDEWLEPPVPPNLKKLSPALESLTEFWRLDPDMVAVAANASQAKQTKKEPLADWIASLPESDRNDYLLRVAQGETHVGTELMQRLRQEFGETTTVSGAHTGRSLAQLVDLAEREQQQRQKRDEIAAQKARNRYLDGIAPKTDQLWKEVFRLIELKQAKPYEEAVNILIDLRDLADYKGTSSLFQDGLNQVINQYAKRPALMRRLQNAQLT